MAMTIAQGPSGRRNIPAYNPIDYVVTSTNTGQANFEFICDLYITGVTFAGGASYFRMKAPVDPTYGVGHFDVAPVIQRYLTGDIGNDIYGFQQCGNSVVEFQPKFGESYGPSSGITVYTNQIFPSANTAFNGSLETLEYKDYVYTDYTADTNAVVNLLSNAPSSGTVRSSQNQWVYVMAATSGIVKFANVNVYTGSGGSKVLGNTYRVMNHAYHDAGTTVANRMLRFPCGGANLNNIVSSSISPSTNDGITSLISQTITAWEIYFTDSSRNRTTDSYWVILDNPCTDHDIYRIHFKNKYGAYDSFNFIRANQVSTEITRNKYEKVMGEFKSASSYVYNKTDAFITNYNTSYKPTIRLNSDWITESQSTWLEELLTSPDIRMEDSSSNLIPMILLETNYTHRQHKTDKIFNIQISMQYTFINTRQGA